MTDKNESTSFSISEAAPNLANENSKELNMVEQELLKMQRQFGRLPPRAVDPREQRLEPYLEDELEEHRYSGWAQRILDAMAKIPKKPAEFSNEELALLPDITEDVQRTKSRTNIVASACEPDHWMQRKRGWKASKRRTIRAS